MIKVKKTEIEALFWMWGAIGRSWWVLGYQLDGRVIRFRDDKWVAHVWRTDW